MCDGARTEITVASAADLDDVRELWREYWESQHLPPDFQGFTDERNALPGVYAPPAGRLLIARIGGSAVGTGAFRPLTARACEAKRMFVRPQYRGRGAATALLERLVKEARACGYSEMYADTLPPMTDALCLYNRYGFVEVASYSDQPTPNAIFLRLSL